MSEPQSELRYQMEVYFESMPETDPKQLEESVNTCEPDAAKCQVEMVDQANLPPAQEGIEVSGFTVSLGDQHIMGLVHSVPAPSDVIEHANLPDEMKNALAGHKAFVLLTALGPEGADPVENIIFLYKVGMALGEQGALGMGLPHSGVVFPTAFLGGLAEKTKTLDSPDDKPVTLWRTLREDGIPEHLLINFAFLPPQMLAPDAGGETLVITRGFSHLGFPDLMYLAQNEKEARSMMEFFHNGYEYMFEAKPQMEAGHTIGGEGGGPVYRLSEPPATFDPPFEAYSVLLVTCKPPKKKLFGIFG